MSASLLRTLILFLALSLAAAGCVPVAAPTAQPPSGAAQVSPASPQPETVVPTVPTTAPAPAAALAGPNGQVVWNGTPIPDARVKLAVQGTCRDAGSDGVLAATVSGANGEFGFPATSTLDWDVCYAWPAGQGDDNFMIGERQPVMPVDGLVLRLSKTLHLVAPDLSVVREAPFEVRWETVDGVTIYRVALVDLGTSELAFQQDVAGPSVMLTEPLEAGHGYMLGVHGLNANGEQIASFIGEFTAAGTPVAPEAKAIQQLPVSCYREGLLTYMDRDTGICFAYPQGFALGGAQGLYSAGSNSQAELRGPAVGSDPEPLFVRVSLDFQPYQGVDLPQFVDEMIKRDVPADLQDKLERTQATWGGHAAEVLEPWPGLLSSRVVVVDAAPGGFNILTFWPSFKDTAPDKLGADAAQAQKEMEALYETVSETFAKLLPPGIPLSPDAALNLPKSCLAAGQPLYVDFEEGYCFALTPEMAVRREADGRVSFYGPALDKSPDPLRAALAVMLEPGPNGTTLEEAVEAYITSLSGPVEQVRRDQITVAGEPAERLDGVPGRPAAVEVLILHNGKLLRFHFTPDTTFAKSEAEVTRLIQAVTSSFGWLPGAATPGQSGTKPGSPAMLHSEPYRGVSLSYPPTVALTASGQTVLAEGEPGGPWWGVSPQHVEISLGSYILQDTQHAPRVAVYPAAEFASSSPDAAQQITALQNLLQAKPENPAVELPLLPLMNAAQQMHSRVEYLPFKSGAGVSYLTQYAQAPLPINNKDLFYTFQGLTGDGKFYVSAILPVAYDSLPASANSVPAAQMDALVNNFAGYLSEVTKSLDAADDSSFKPALADLDALVQSIEVEPGALASETDIQVELKKRPDVNPTYTVHQVPAVLPADNINLYDAHPPLALVQFGGYARGQASALPYSFGGPAVQVYRVADLQSFPGIEAPLGFAAQYEALKKLLSERGSLVACSGVTLKPGANMVYPALPFVPPLNSSQAFCVQPAFVDFRGGTGIRYLTAFSQGIDSLSDESAFYTFQGLTDDGKYYVSAVLPVKTGVLPAKAGEGIDPSAWNTTLKGWADTLGALDGSAFQPSLEVLDSLVGSLSVR